MFHFNNGFKSERILLCASNYGGGTGDLVIYRSVIFRKYVIWAGEIGSEGNFSNLSFVLCKLDKK